MSLPRVKIADLKPKEVIKSVFLIKYMSVNEAKDGKKYLNIVFTDGNNDLEGRSWSNAEKIDEIFSKGEFILVEGKINMFQGRKQFIMQKYDTVDSSSLNLDDFIQKSTKDPEVMYQELLEIVENLTDVYIKELLQSIIKDEEISRRLKLWQAGKSIHHAYQSGLLEHILSCTKLSVSLSPHYNVNVNYVVAGAILHDICKIYELSDGVNVEYTEEGKLVGHLVKVLEIIDRFSYRIKDFPYQVKLHLKHIMLSHHGEYEYGSPKIPQTSEAMLVHLIDNLDSKMHSFETVKRNDNNSGHWTGFVRHLDRIIFKDDLPFYPEHVDRADQKKTGGQAKPQSKSESKPGVKTQSKEIKNNLGSLLKDFKVGDE
jgi:3'-5' exoribonuclease